MQINGEPMYITSLIQINWINPVNHQPSVVSPMIPNFGAELISLCITILSGIDSTVQLCIYPLAVTYLHKPITIQ